MKKLPTFQYEHELRNTGYTFIAGIDEVGRGCFAGPVVAGAVVFAKETIESFFNKEGEFTKDGVKINDSKKLRANERKMSSIWIKKHALSWGIGEVSVSVINRIGVGKSAHLAFKKAISKANVRLAKKSGLASANIDFLLIDAFQIPDVEGLPLHKQLPIIKGDTKSISIAAASIVAKVHRDTLMEELGMNPEYAIYDWSSNKGYGTQKHLDSIRKHGITEYHRKQFVETWKRKQGL